MTCVLVKLSHWSYVMGCLHAEAGSIHYSVCLSALAAICLTLGAFFTDGLNSRAMGKALAWFGICPALLPCLDVLATSLSFGGPP